MMIFRSDVAKHASQRKQPLPWSLYRPRVRRLQLSRTSFATAVKEILDRASQRGGHHCSTASLSTVRSAGLLSLTSTRFKVISPRLWRTFSGRARGGSSLWGTTQENKVTKGSKEQDVKHEEQESVGSLKFVVELTSDRASANAELSAVMQHLCQVEQRSSCFIPTSRQRGSVGRKMLLDLHAPCVFEYVRSLVRQPC